MRTTLILNDELVVSAKRAAAERRMTLSSVVNEALRATFMATGAKGEAPRFRMPVFRGDGQSVDTSPRALSALVEDVDLAPFAK